MSVHCEDDPWQKYYVRFEEPECETIPVGCVLTMVGTGSEMNAGSVITNQETKQKIGHVFADEAIMPKFSILNPRYTMTLPHYQMVSGIMTFSTIFASSTFRERMTIPVITSVKD